ncbi:hypothetical protein [Vibrio sp. 99-8-1]|uniref:hypothetical protein n=1 Tax=Vibrio sp. 99-8-1 TaxID=2607602 RepID=UPI00149331AF|nr:hypothetical protein [Vibrio sp. 99-8-1]NOI65344.1 hypothetical protein [Vibrio sp. 99-8-1]
MTASHQPAMDNAYLSISQHSSSEERHYRDSIFSLEERLMANPTCIESIKAWISGYHQLATIYQLRGQYLLAQKCLLIPHQSMLYMAHNCHDEEVELIAIRAINITLPKLIEFTKVHPPCKNCMNELREQMSAIEQQNRQFH